MSQKNNIITEKKKLHEANNTDFDRELQWKLKKTQ